MFRSPTLFAPLCLAFVGCSTPPSAAPAGAPESRLALEMTDPSAGPTAEAAAGGWTTGILGLDASAPAPSVQEGSLSTMDSRHLTLLLGERQLDDDDWDPVEDQLAGGVEVDGTDPSTGHGYEIGMTYSQDDDDIGPVDVTGDTLDVYGGYRHTFRLESREIHPYLSAGLALIRAQVEVDGPINNNDEDDISPGAYVRAGIGFDLSDRTRLGVDYRHMFLTDVDIGGISDADFDQIMLTLGFAF